MLIARQNINIFIYSDMKLPISLGYTHQKNVVETLLPLLVLSSISTNNSYLVCLSHKAGRFV